MGVGGWVGGWVGGEEGGLNEVLEARIGWVGGQVGGFTWAQAASARMA